MSKTASSQQLIGLVSLVLLPAILAAGLMIHFAERMPVVDDYFTVIQYSLNYLALPDTGQRLLYIVGAQHMEYKFVFEHILLSADLSLTHRIHMSFLNLVGDLFLPAIFWLLWRLFRVPGQDTRRRLLLFVPASLLFCGLDYVDALNFPSASLDYLPVIFFSFSALLLLTRPTLSTALFGLACLCALLADFCAVNAFLLFPIGGWILLRRRAFLRLAAWTAVTAIGFSPYVYRYQPMPHHSSPGFVIMPLFFLSFAGCGSPVHKLAIPLGLVILAATVRAVRSGFVQAHAGSFCCMIWLLLSGAMTAYGRSWYGLGMSLSSRYQIFSALLLVFSYQIGLHATLPQRGFSPSRMRVLYVASVFFSVIFFLRADYLGWRYFTERRQEIRIGLSQFRADPARRSPMYFIFPDQERDLQQAEADAGEYTRQAIATGIFSLPEQ